MQGTTDVYGYDYQWWNVEYKLFILLNNRKGAEPVVIDDIDLIVFQYDEKSAVTNRRIPDEVFHTDIFNLSLIYGQMASSTYIVRRCV